MRGRLREVARRVRIRCRQKACKLLGRALFREDERRLLVVHGGFSGWRPFNAYETVVRFMHGHDGWSADGLVCSGAVSACEFQSCVSLGGDPAELAKSLIWHRSCDDCADKTRGRFDTFCRGLVTQAEHLGPDDYARAERIVNALGDDLNVRIYSRFEFEGIAVGAYAYQSFQRFFRLGRVDKLVLKRGGPAREFLKSGILQVISARRILPDYALIVVGDIGRTQWGVWADVAFEQGKQVLLCGPQAGDGRLIPRLSSDAFEFRHREPDYPGAARVQRALARFDDPATLARGRETLERRFGPRVPADEIRRKLDLAPNACVAVVFAHICWDHPLAFGNSPLSSYEEWLGITYDVAVEHQDVTWVFKLHPEERLGRDCHTEFNTSAYLHRRFEAISSPNVRLLEERGVSTYDLAQIAHVGITATGSVSYEFPAFGVNCLTLTRGVHSGHGFTVDTDSVEGYIEQLHRVRDLPSLTDDAQKRALAYAAATAAEDLSIDARDLVESESPFLPPIQLKRFVRRKLAAFQESIGRRNM